MLSLDNLKVRDIESGFLSRRPSFALFNTEGRSVGIFDSMMLLNFLLSSCLNFHRSCMIFFYCASATLVA